MTGHDISGSLVDVCTACAGVWIEWFDGEPNVLAGLLPPGSTAAHPPGQMLCPACKTRLDETGYPDESSEARVHRCGHCVGTFVTADGLATLARAGAPVREDDEDTFLSWLISRLKVWQT